MNRKITSLLIMCLGLMCGSAWAESISESQARQIAANFMTIHAIPSTNLKMARKAPKLNSPGVGGDKAAYYVFNGQDRGYVIVAGDDRAPTVLGYSDEGYFDPQAVPEGMQVLLDGYAVQMAALEGGAKAATRLTANSPIPPLVSAQWDQGLPYNIEFPMLPNGRIAYVGCVATAMAQVMYYWKHPVRPSAPIPAYTSPTYSVYMPSLPAVDFNWTAMQDSYADDDDNMKGALAASELSLYCAQSVRMNFGNGSSGAQTGEVARALINYFGYKPTAKYLDRELYTSKQWEDMLYAELAAGRPVVYDGAKIEAGHAFVCDGYDGNGRYHINWGWNGVSNGYFLLSLLNPDEQGTGSASGAYGYIYHQGMITGIEPGSGTMPNDFAVTINHFEVTGSTTTRSGSSYNFSVSLKNHFTNRTSQNISFEYGWGLYKNGTLQKVLSRDAYDELPPQYFITIDRTLQFGSNISSGNYLIIPIYSERNKTQWRPCAGATMNYLDVSISSTRCTIIVRGIGNTPDFTVNDISTSGHMHTGRPVNISLDLTNNGYTRNDFIHMFVNGQFYASAYADIEHGKKGTAEFMYMNRTAGTYNLTFCYKDDGTQEFASLPVTITAMPAANLKGNIKVLNVTSTTRKIVSDNKMSIDVTVNNPSDNAYNEDITVELYKRMSNNYGVPVQTQNQAISLGGHQSTSLHFDLDNVINGWRYFVRVYYYSQGSRSYMGSTDVYTLYYPGTEPDLVGDVNGDGEINIADVNATIDVILGATSNSAIIERADVNSDGEVNIADVNMIIDTILGN